MIPIKIQVIVTDLMNILPTGSWEVFMEWSPNGVFIPEEISEEIFLILKKEQLRAISHVIRKKYVRGFHRELDTWIPGLRISGGSCRVAELEREEARVHCSDCHPGRFYLNPDAGLRAVGGNSAALCCGGYPTSCLKHRKLSSNWVIHNFAHGIEYARKSRRRGGGLINFEAGEPAATFSRHARTWRKIEGFQDVYFLGGLPLLYWSFGGQMGMKLPDRDMAKETESLSGNWMWRGPEDVDRYKLTDGLLAWMPAVRATTWHSTSTHRWVYEGYLQREEQNMINGSYRYE